MVIPAGLEPATYSLGNCRSIQLSYGTVSSPYQISKTDGTTLLRRLIAFAALGLITTSASAQPLLCEAEGAAPVEITRIEPDGTLVPRQGPSLRMVGIVWPDALEPAAREKARTTLLGAIKEDIITIKPAGPADRWGIVPAHVFLREKGSEAAPFWLQAGLVEQGLVPAWPELPDLCWKTLISHERAARSARRGYWAPRAQAYRHRVIQAAPQDHLARRMVARWRVFSTRKSQVLTYVNITPSFRVGPSIGLTARQVDMLNRQGNPPETLAGRKIIVRFLSGPAGLLRVRLAQGDALIPDED